MKKLFFTIFCILIGIYYSVGQTIGYTYKPLAAEGCSVKYNVVYTFITYAAKLNNGYYGHIEVAVVAFGTRIE